MELTPTGTVILGFLSGEEMSGYDIKTRVDESTRFFWAASYGQIYPELKRLAGAGLIETVDQAGGDLLIGMNREKRKQSHPVRPFATLPAWWALDGIIDELKIHSAVTTDFVLRPGMPPADPKPLPVMIRTQ